MIRKLDDSTVKVCCGRNGCPTVEKIDEEYYKVTDDSGNSIVVKKDELELMGDAITTINEDQQLING
tara:strand:+ start:3057 stop:3257 length:201 start_codon:yes stop_codon:yes gene_type:complete